MRKKIQVTLILSMLLCLCFLSMNVRSENSICYTLLAGGVGGVMQQYRQSDLSPINNVTYELGANIFAIAQDDDYLYAGGNSAGTACIKQYWKGNLTQTALNASYGVRINCIASDGIYLYAGGFDGMLRQYWRDNMTLKATANSGGSSTYDIAFDDTHVYAVGDMVRHGMQFYKSNLTSSGNTTDFGIWADLRSVLADDTYVYFAGSNNSEGRIFQCWQSNLTKRTETIDTGGFILSMVQDDTYIYSGGNGIGVYKFWKSNMTAKTYAPNVAYSAYEITQDDLYIYSAETDGDRFTPTCWIHQYLKSDMSEVQNTTHFSVTYGGDIYALMWDPIIVQTLSVSEIDNMAGVVYAMVVAVFALALVGFVLVALSKIMHK